ncbi:MAG: hypothetical protein HRT73_12150 [Flavobacteriales bacterium]|nr:hypothetical protein [Flavobacteriales bacterium]
MWIYTYKPTNGLSTFIFNSANSIISETHFFPLNYFWDYIPIITVRDISPKTLYIVFIPPFVIYLIAFINIVNYKSLKAYDDGLNREVARKLALRKKEAAAGIYEGQNPETININVTKEEPKVTTWDNKWWGKIIIPLLVLILATAFGLRTI